MAQDNMHELSVPTNTNELAPAQRLDENPAAVYLASLAPGSRPAMERALTVVAQILTADEEAAWQEIPWQRLRFQHTAVVRAQLVEEYAHSTTNKMLSAIRGTLKAAWKLGLMEAEEYQKAASVENVKGETVPAGRAVAAGELVGLLDTCDQTRLGIRDAAIIAMLYAGGLRRAELVGLDLGDYIKEESRLRVRGKRNKQRLVPVVGGAGAALADWLAVRGSRPGICGNTAPTTGRDGPTRRRRADRR